MAAATDSWFKTLDGCDIAYTLHPAPQPEAPRVALVHSLALDRSIWNGVVAQLAGSTHLLTYDFRARNAQTIAQLTKVFLANDVSCYEATCAMLGNDDLRPLLHSIVAPTAIVVGEEDYATPVAMAEALHKAIPQSSLKVISKGRHITPVECPEQIAGAITSLLGVQAKAK